jgi:uncharacterized protein YndB with AHSA1/START domain
MRWALITVGVLVALALLVVLVGAMLPKGHVAAVTARISAPPAAVFAALTDPISYPQWRADVTRVEPLPTHDGAPAWREVTKQGAITFAMESLDPPRRAVARVTDRTLPFGGTWEYVLVPDGAGTRVTITERGEVYNPVFRFVSRVFMSPTATATAFLAALDRKFGGA